MDSNGLTVRDCRNKNKEETQKRPAFSASNDSIILYHFRFLSIVIPLIFPRKPLRNPMQISQTLTNPYAVWEPGRWSKNRQGATECGSGNRHPVQNNPIRFKPRLATQHRTSDLLYTTSSRPIIADRVTAFVRGQEGSFFIRLGLPTSPIHLRWFIHDRTSWTESITQPGATCRHVRNERLTLCPTVPPRPPTPTPFCPHSWKRRWRWQCWHIRERVIGLSGGIAVSSCSSVSILKVAWKCHYNSYNRTPTLVLQQYPHFVRSQTVTLSTVGTVIGSFHSPYIALSQIRHS